MKQEIKEITEKLEQGVKGVFEDASYKEYLTFMSKFHQYSSNNIMLILMQKPDASLVAGYKAWQTKFKRQVKKGEKGLTILAPCQHKVEKEDEDGNIKEIRWTSFRAIKVFDISQTDGEDVPKTHICKTLTGDVDGYKGLLERLIKASPVPVAFEQITNGAHGYYHIEDKRIAIKDGMSEQQTVKTLVHEIAHASMHDRADSMAKDADSRTREVQAESVAYTVCSMLGLDTSDYSFGYIAGWSEGKELKELTASLEVIRKTASDLIDRLAA